MTIGLGSQLGEGREAEVYAWSDAAVLTLTQCDARSSSRPFKANAAPTTNTSVAR